MQTFTRLLILDLLDPERLHQCASAVSQRMSVFCYCIAGEDEAVLTPLRLLRADQKAKARTNLRNSPRKRPPVKDEPPPIKASRREPRSPKFEPSLENPPAEAPDIKPMVDRLKADPDGSKISSMSDLPVLGLKEDPTTALAPRIKPDDMSFFWQCQSPGQTGDLKGCGFFKILDMRAEGRGPCVADT